MTVWTPAQHVRVKVLGLVWRGEELLAAEIEDSSGRVRGVRPLGGGIEFGETREEALIREFREELGCAVTVAGPWHCFENIYAHEGAIGHEYDFAVKLKLSDEGLYDQERIQYLESDESNCTAGWFTPGRLPQGVALYPEALARAVAQGIVSPDG